MDQEKYKSSTPTNSVKTQTKSPQKHQEHNYTNTQQVNETSVPAKETTTGEVEEVDNQSNKTPGFKLNPTQFKVEIGPRQPPPTTVPLDRQPLEMKNKVIKKDVFNRIRRSEEELQKAAEMVRGGMTFQTASDTFNIPISTIRFYMARRGILPQRRRGRGSSGVRDDDLIHPPFEIIHYRLPDIDKPL